MNAIEMKKKIRIMSSTFSKLLLRNDICPDQLARYVLEHCPSAVHQIPESPKLVLQTAASALGKALGENIRHNIDVVDEAVNCITNLAAELLKLDLLTMFAKSEQGQIRFTNIFDACSKGTRQMVEAGHFDIEQCVQDATLLRLAEATLETLVSEGKVVQSDESLWTMVPAGEDAHKELCYILSPLFTPRQPG